MSENLPNCPICDCEYTYELGALLVCPECAHEWQLQEAVEAPRIACQLVLIEHCEDRRVVEAGDPRDAGAPLRRELEEDRDGHGVVGQDLDIGEDVFR